MSMSLLVVSLSPGGLAGARIENHPAVVRMVGEPESVQQVAGADIERAAADALTASEAVLGHLPDRGGGDQRVSHLVALEPWVEEDPWRARTASAATGV